MKAIFSGFLFFGTGGLFMVAGLFVGWRTVRLLLKGVRTEATVVESGSPGAPAMIEFDDRSGARHRTNLSMTGGGQKRGQTMMIVYDPNRPTDFIGTSFMEKWMFPCIFTAVGGVAMFIGVAIWLGWAHTE